MYIWKLLSDGIEWFFFRLVFQLINWEVEKAWLSWLIETGKLSAQYESSNPRGVLTHPSSNTRSTNKSLPVNSYALKHFHYQHFPQVQVDFITSFRSVKYWKRKNLYLRVWRGNHSHSNKLFYSLIPWN